MKSVHNLATDEVYYYTDATPDLVAVCSAYCTAESHMAVWLTHMIMAKVPFAPSLPVVESTLSISCGDWSILKTTMPTDAPT